MRIRILERILLGLMMVLFLPSASAFAFATGGGECDECTFQAKVYYDANQNGFKDGDEVYVPDTGWWVALYDQGWVPMSLQQAWPGGETIFVIAEGHTYRFCLRGQEDEVGGWMLTEPALPGGAVEPWRDLIRFSGGSVSVVPNEGANAESEFALCYEVVTGYHCDPVTRKFGLYHPPD